MLRRLLLLLALSATAALAQTTVVSGTVADANQNAYFPGTVSAYIALASGQALPAGVPASGSLGPTPTTAGGVFSITVPSPFSWSFTFCGTPVNLGPRGNNTPTQTCFSTAAIAISGASQALTALQIGTVPLLGPGGSASGGGALVDQVVQSGLMAEYRILATETPASLVDYSSNARNATGTVGTAPTVITATGGLACGGAGAVSLPAALNSALTVQIFASFQSGGAQGGLAQGTGNVQTLLGGNNASHFIALDLFETPVPDAFGPDFQGGDRLRSAISTGFNNQSLDTFQGADVISFLLSTQDTFYIGQTPTIGGSANASAGLQTAGNYQLCGVSPSGTTLNWSTANIYYAVFYNRVLNAAELAQNVAFMRNSMAARGVPVLNGATDQQPQIICSGDSLTAAGTNYCNALPILAPTSSVLPYVNPINFNVANQGFSGIGSAGLITNVPTMIGSLLRPTAASNIVIHWVGTNDSSTTAIGTSGPNIRNFCLQLHQLQPTAKCLVGTMLSRGSLDSNKNILNDFLRRHWPEFSDGLVDFAANPNLGADGASANTTYFNVDGIHLNTTGNSLVTGIAQQAILRAIGNTATSGQPVTVPPQFQNLQCASNFCSASASSCAVVMPKSTLVGDFLFASILGPQGGATINAPTDTRTSTWASVAAAVNTSSHNMQAWIAPNITAGAETITANFASAGTNSIIQACEYSGVATATPQDAASTITSSFSVPFASSNVTTTAANELYIQYATDYNNSGVAPFNFQPIIYTQTPALFPRATTYQFGNSQGLAAFIADTVSGVAGTYSSVLTVQGQSGVAGQGVAAFKVGTRIATYQMTGADVLVYCNPSVASSTISLPDAIGFTGQTFTIKNVQTSGVNTCTVAGINSETIDGSASVTVANKATLIVQSQLVSPTAAGANWVQLQNN